MHEWSDAAQMIMSLHPILTSNTFRSLIPSIVITTIILLIGATKIWNNLLHHKYDPQILYTCQKTRNINVTWMSTSTQTKRLLKLPLNPWLYNHEGSKEYRHQQTFRWKITKESVKKRLNIDSASEWTENSADGTWARGIWTKRKDLSEIFPSTVSDALHIISLILNNPL
jgi:hypothetical protein